MSGRDIKILHVIRKIFEKGIKQIKAARLLDLSVRQVGRLVKRVKELGSRGVIHGNCGKQSNRRIKGEVRQRALRLCRKKYRGFGPTLASEKLHELDGIKVSDETLRRWFKKESISYSNRRSRPHRKWRRRKEHYGEMLQMDGSKHDWLEGRGPEMVLMGYIDDATGCVYGRFYDHEGTMPAMDSFMRYVKQNGIPCSVYSDRHSTYKLNAKLSVQEELNGQQEAWSQFRRALEELGVRIIYAYSPQAKGRIERLFRTFQDRLIKEMRLSAVSTMEEANEFLGEYLPIYCKKFSVLPASKTDLHRPVSKGLDLISILSRKNERTLRNDFTVAFQSKLYQVENRVRAKRVTVEQRVDGSMRITNRGKILRYAEIERKQKTVEEKEPLQTPSPGRAHAPAPNHPWRDFKYGSKSITAKGSVEAP